jgi:hypothetical protein
MWTHEEERANARSIMSRHIDKAIERGDIRPHERDRAIDLAVNNWKGNMGNGQAADLAIEAFKKGIVR